MWSCDGSLGAVNAMKNRPLVGRSSAHPRPGGRAGVSNILGEARLLTAFRDGRTDARANGPLPIPPWQFPAAATPLPFGVDLLMSDMFASSHLHPKLR